MKTLKIIFLSLLFGLITYCLTAQQVPNFVTSITKGEKPSTLLIQLSNLDDERTQIDFTTPEGYTVYKTEITKENSYGAYYNMEGMAYDDYLIRISNKNGQFLEPFYYDEDGISLNRIRTKLIPRIEKGRLIARFDPVKNAPKIEVRVANLKEQPFTLYLVKLNGEKFFSEKTKGEHAYAKRFNLEGMEEGDYYFFVRTGEATVWQNFGYDEGEVNLKKKFHRGNVSGDLPKVQVVAIRD